MKASKTTIAVPLISLFFGALFSFSTIAEVELKFVEERKFSDYELMGKNRRTSLIALQKDFKKLFTKIAAKHDMAERSLEIDVTNIDLPGIYHYSYGPQNENMRVVESHTPYKLYFSFRLKGESGAISKEGEYKIKKFLDSTTSSRIKRRNNGIVGYYEKPLEKWFTETFAN